MSEKTRDDKITVTLAHMLPADEAGRLGATEVRKYKPGQDIEVPRASAEMLFNAAYLNGNPKNPEHAKRILGGGDDEAPPAPPVAAPAPAAPAPAATASSTPAPATSPAAAAAALPGTRLVTPGSQG